MTTLETLLFVGLLAASLIAWSQVFGRLRRGEEAVPYEPRRPVPWPGTATLLVVMLYLMLQGAASGLVRTWYDPGDDVNAPSFLLHVLQGHAVACVLVLTIAPLVLKSFAPQTTLDDMGFGLGHLWYDVRLGGVAFFAIVPPVLLIQVLLSLLVGESRHPLVEGWKRGGGAELLLWSILGAVIGAPLVEEFLFRGVLQGWFERLYSADEAPSQPSSQEASPSIESVAVVVPAPPTWTPIVFSSLLFALAHLGNGPDPVPIFFLALGLGYLYRQTHRLLPGIVVHMLLNAFSTAVLVLGIGT